MEGETNWAYMYDDGETLEAGHIDSGFYRSSLVIDFSREYLPEPNDGNISYITPTKRVAFETARQIHPKKLSFHIDYEKDIEVEDEKRNVESKAKKRLYILYCIGVVLITIGRGLIIFGINTQI